MFDRLVRRRVRDKLRRGQAAGAGLPAAVLVVDLAAVPRDDAWDVEHYRDAFIASVEQHVAPRLLGHDAVAFVDRERPRCLVAADGAPGEMIELLNDLRRGPRRARRRTSD